MLSQVLDPRRWVEELKELGYESCGINSQCHHVFIHTINRKVLTDSSPHNCRHAIPNFYRSYASDLAHASIERSTMDTADVQHMHGKEEHGKAEHKQTKKQKKRRN
jgi:hypothetical protein